MEWNDNKIAEKTAAHAKQNKGEDGKDAFWAEREINVELESGRKGQNVLYSDINQYILLIENGEEDFLILNSKDGFFQFYGVNNQFVAETRINLPDGDFRTYQIINREKEHLTQKVHFVTPYGEFTPQERMIVSLDTIQMVVRKYYENGDSEKFLQQIPCVDITEEIKRCMGLIK